MEQSTYECMEIEVFEFETENDVITSSCTPPDSESCIPPDTEEW